MLRISLSIYPIHQRFIIDHFKWLAVLLAILYTFSTILNLLIYDISDILIDLLIQLEWLTLSCGVTLMVISGKCKRLKLTIRNKRKFLNA